MWNQKGMKTKIQIINSEDETIEHPVKFEFQVKKYILHGTYLN